MARVSQLLGFISFTPTYGLNYSLSDIKIYIVFF